jgi:hypothetical protein
MAPDEFYPISEESMTARVQFPIPNNNFRQVLESIGNAISQYEYPIGNMNNISSNERRTLYSYQPTMDLFTEINEIEPTIRCRYCNHLNYEYQITQIHSLIGDSPIVNRFMCSNCRRLQNL